MTDRAMYRCGDCETLTAQSRACPYCNSKDLEEISDG